MTQTRLDEAEVFRVARDIGTPEARAAYLRQVCGNDAVLHKRVVALLHVADDEQSFLERPPAEYERTVTPQVPTEAPGTTIGPYKLLEQIGEGGFGVVFMAEQTAPVKRKVAVKVIKPGMDTRQVIARFEAERQALALMDHPNIAKVFDAGTTGGGARSQETGVRGHQADSSLTPDSCLLTPSVGRPYFVMELVRGVPITDYCDQHQLTPRERLELFITVCQAVQHAHQKGIIHRDIKPTNVLVTLHDDKPVAKVIDFGIAKATSGQLTDRTLYTGFAQLIGTPLYMSPEQASLSGLDVDTRSDIYSLGVLLYELLTGTTPFDKARLQAAAFDEIRRIIQEEEPPRPSTRISTLRNAETAPAAQRPGRWKQARPMVLGELDWIVMKALEKDRNRRYESASALARDVERHLRSEPVQACPPSNWYRFRKFARRNKSALAAATVMGLGVLLSVAALAISALRIGRQQVVTTAALRAETKANDELARTLARERLEAYFQRISGAQRALSMDDLGLALKLLEECPRLLRDWEWRYLMRLCRVDPLVLSANTEINGLAFSPDGERTASACGDGSVKIWNSRREDRVQAVLAHSDAVVSVVFHPEGKHLATAGADGLVKVWDLTTTDRPVFSGPCDAIRKFGAAYTVAFSPPDGRLLAAGSGGVVRVWDWANDQERRNWPGYKIHSIPVAFSPDGQCLATGDAGQQGQRLWDVKTGELLRTLPAHALPVSALAFSRDGGRLASASMDRSVTVYDTATGAHVSTFHHTGNVLCVAFSHNGRRVASAGEDKTVRIWDAATGREVLGLRGHTDLCQCLAFSPDPDGWRLASASADGTIRVWDATPLREDERQEILTFTEHKDEIRCVAFSPDGRRIVSAGHGGRVKVWDPETKRVDVDYPGHRIITWSVAWQPPHGLRIASAGADGPEHAVKVWDAGNGREVLELYTGVPGFARRYFAVAFSPDGHYLATGKENGDVQVWNAETGREIHKLGTHDREVRGLVFSRDGRWLASSSDGTVMLWDGTRLDQDQQPRLIRGARVPGPCVNVAFSPDGRWLSTGGRKNTVIIWDVEAGHELQTLEGHNGEVYTVAFSPDGRWLASAGEDSAVKVWASHTGKLVRSFRGHEGLVSSLAFSPDGRRLVSGSRDTTVKVWDVTRLSDSEGEH